MVISGLHLEQTSWLSHLDQKKAMYALFSSSHVLTTVPFPSCHEEAAAALMVVYDICLTTMSNQWDIAQRGGPISRCSHSCPFSCFCKMVISGGIAAAIGIGSSTLGIHGDDGCSAIVTALYAAQYHVQYHFC